jgi:hypothetical protein
MASGDDYLQFADQCLALAATSSNPADKARLLQMAQAWCELSEKRAAEQETGADPNKSSD